ncbi:MAG: SCP2 sterol-binding domain-containing protein [Mycobacteriales bacterium]
MATEAECELALRSLVAKLAAVDPEVRSRYLLERTVSCRISDLGVTWRARLCDEGLVDVSSDDDSKAQVRLTVASDDLLALIEGRLAVTTAFAIGKLRVQASPLDLLRLGSFL